LERAQHKEYKQLKRGQLFASISDIRTGVAWYVGYRKETPTKDQIFQILEWMRNTSAKATTGATTKAPMITTTKATHGIFIKIENYCVYQDPRNYESNTGSNDRSNNENSATPNNINKNDKNDKNDKKYKIIRSPIEIAIDDFKEFRKKIKKPMTDRAVELLVDKLNKLASDDETKIAILNQSIVNGWQGVFPLKGDTQRQSGTNNPFLQEGV
jgi:hypothetical protein